MPFDLTQLNGVTFQANETAQGVGANSAVQSSGPELANPTGTDQVIVTYINTLADGPSTVISSTNSYTPGFVSNGTYYLPTFGTIVFTAGSTNGLSSATIFVHGFSNGAIIGSINNANLGFTSGTYGGQANGFFVVLSNYDLGAGPNSPNYSTYFAPDVYGVYHGVYNGHLYNVPADGNPNPPQFPITFTKDSTTYTPPCFAEGVRVLTTEGEVRVEDLAVGDVALTASGALRPVIWIGSRQVRPAAYPDPCDVNPVRVRAHAFAPGRPSRDLVLSPGHAVFVDGALVPVARLVNGATVVQEAVDLVRYFHVELDAHDVLLADGLACESFLDDGNRATFANSDLLDLYGRLDPLDREHACAPMLRDGEDAADAARLGAVRERLRARAEALGWVEGRDGSVFLRLADGSRVEPLRAVDGRAWFFAPAGAVRLVSAAGRPCEFAPVDADRRRLGVAVAQARLDGAVLPLDGPAFGAGFHPLEEDGAQAWRWTDGEATLTLPAAGLLELALPMVALSWRRADLPALRLVAG